MRNLIRFLLLLLIIPTTVQAQDLQGLLDTLAMVIPAEVKVGSDIYRQEIQIDEEDPCRIQFRKVTLDSKGRMTTHDYFFHAADLDLEAMQVTESRKTYFLEVPMLRRQYLVEYYEDQVPQNYLRSFNIYATEIIGAKRVENQIRKIPPICNSLFEQSNNFENAEMEQLLDWLVANTVDVVELENTLRQQLSRKELQTGLGLELKQTKDEPGEVDESEVFLVNAGDLDGANAEMVIRGREVYVEVPVFARQRYVQATDGDGHVHFDNTFRIRVKGIDEARSMVRVFQKVTPGAAQLKKERMDRLGEPGNALSKLGAMNFSATRGSVSFRVRMSGDCFAQWTILQKDGNREKSGEYLAYLQDIERVEMIVNGGIINVQLAALDGNRYVEFREDGKRQAFTDRISLPVGDIDSGRVLRYLLEQAIKACRQEPMEVAGDNPSSFIKFLADEGGEVETRRGKKIQTFRSASEDNPCAVEMVRYDKGEEDKKMVYDFSLSDINPESVRLYISGNEIAVDIETNGRQNLIRTLENDEPADLVATIRIWAKDLRDARRKAYALQSAAVGCLDR